jgi:hypothetical protein
VLPLQPLAHKTRQGGIIFRNQNPHKWALITARFELEKAQLKRKPLRTKGSVCRNGALFQNGIENRKETASPGCEVSDRERRNVRKVKPRSANGNPTRLGSAIL